MILTVDASTTNIPRILILEADPEARTMLRELVISGLQDASVQDSNLSLEDAVATPSASEGSTFFLPAATSPRTAQQKISHSGHCARWQRTPRAPPLYYCPRTVASTRLYRQYEPARSTTSPGT